MGCLLVIGEHGKITAKERKRICDCWFPKTSPKPPNLECKRPDCFLGKEEIWRKMTTEEQIADDARRAEKAKEAVDMIDKILATMQPARSYFHI